MKKVELQSVCPGYAGTNFTLKSIMKEFSKNNIDGVTGVVTT